MRYLSYPSSEDFSIVSPLKQFLIMIRCSGFTRCAHSWVIELNIRREILYIYIHARPRIIPYSWWSLGMICDDFWNPSHAHVVFKQLAFDGAKGSLFSAAFGHGTWDGCNVVWWRGTLWLKNTVFRCRHKGWRGSNCGHWEDVSVRCDSTWRKTYF